MFPHRVRLPVVNLAVSAPSSVAEPISHAEKMGVPGGPKTRKSEWSWKVVSAGKEIDQLAPDWRELLPEKAGPFQTFSWNRAWYRHFADAYDESAIFVVSKGGKVAAIFPCYRKGSEIRMAGDLCCDFQDVIASDEESVRIGLGLFIAWVKLKHAGCDLFFEKLSTRGLLYPVLKHLDRGRLGVFAFRKNYGPCPWVELPESLDAWLAAMPRKVRGDWRRSLNRLDRELPEAEVLVHRDCGIPGGAVRDAAEFHRRHFRLEGSSPLADPRLVSLLEEVAPREDVGLRLSLMKVGRIPLAIDFGFTRGETYYGYLTGFDETFGKLAPGKCLLLRRVNWWRQEDGVRVLDFLCGGERYKDGFTQGNCYHVCSVRLLARTIPNAARMMTLWSEWLFRGLSKRTLRFFGFDASKAVDVSPLAEVDDAAPKVSASHPKEEESAIVESTRLG